MRVDAYSAISANATPVLDNSNRIGSSEDLDNDPKLKLTHSIQSTFSAILESVGREGYASADPVASDRPLADDAVAGWEQWFETVGRTCYSDYVQWTHAAPEPTLTSAESFKESYSEILRDAYSQGGYATPKEFLAGLSSDQLHNVQQVHRLAEPIQVDGLSEEGALNLLIPPCAAVDSNRDGLSAVGVAMTIGFPDSTTPRDIRDAWDAATANLPEEEIALRSLQMKMPLLLANMHVDAEGKYVGQAEPGDADWVNPMVAGDYSYRKAAKGWLDYLDAFRNQIPPEQYLRDQAFWSDFLGRLPAEADPTVMN